MAGVLLAVNGVVRLLGSDNSVGGLDNDCQGDNSGRWIGSETHSLIFNDNSMMAMKTPRLECNPFWKRKHVHSLSSDETHQSNVSSSRNLDT